MPDYKALTHLTGNGDGSVKKLCSLTMPERNKATARLRQYKCWDYFKTSTAYHNNFGKTSPSDQ
jgi:hypothetical protein